MGQEGKNKGDGLVPLSWQSVHGEQGRETQREYKRARHPSTWASKGSGYGPPRLQVPGVETSFDFWVDGKDCTGRECAALN